MPVDKLAPQMQLNCIITPIDFVLDFKMHRYLVASLSKEDSESQSPSVSRKQKKVYQMIREKQFSKWSPYLFIDVQ